MREDGVEGRMGHERGKGSLKRQTFRHSSTVGSSPVTSSAMPLSHWPQSFST